MAIYGHTPIYEFTDYDTNDLIRALKLYSELDNLNMASVDDEYILEIISELKKRGVEQYE